MSDFKWDMLTPEDREIARRILGEERQPDVDIQPDGKPYLYRWWVIPRRAVHANVYLHVQVASDPERPLHDHPWDNQSVILSGGYHELMQRNPPWGPTTTRSAFKDATVHRRATEAHRLILPENVPYTMTLFTTGPVEREWGFWFLDFRGQPQWASEAECIVRDGDRSLFKLPERFT